MKIFAISDVHGEYDAMINSLKNAGFDENNENHLLISLGDAFDRGEDSVKVYEYLKKLSDNGKAIVLKGNHTKFFIEYLDGTSISPFNWRCNGTNKTLDDFSHRTSAFQSWCILEDKEPTYDNFVNWLKITRNEINQEYPELLPWLKERPYYFETQNYIFTHGAVDTKVDDWHKPHCYRYNLIDWDALSFDDGSFFGNEIGNTDKIVVIGHFHTRALREKYNIDDKKDKDDILIRDDKKIVAIDTCTNLTKRVNVFVIDDKID